MIWLRPISFFFFFNDTATTEIYTLSLHDALPISFSAQTVSLVVRMFSRQPVFTPTGGMMINSFWADRKSTRLNSSHGYISYAVFCLKKKKQLVTPVRVRMTRLTEDSFAVRTVQPI